MIKKYKKIDMRILIISLILGLVYAFCTLFGYHLEEYENVEFSTVKLWFQLLGMTLLYAIFVCGALFGISKINLKKNKKTGTIKDFWLTALLIFVIWSPQLIGVYPGFFNYDADVQWLMYINYDITAHHPPLHTWLLGTIISLGEKITGSIHKGTFIFVVLQMLMFAGCFSYVIQYLRNKRMPKWLITFGIGWFAIFPTVVINVFSVTKDNFFAAFLMVFIVMTLQMLEEPERYLRDWRFISGWSVITVLMVIMRNNAIYITILFIPLLFIMLRKHWKRMLIVIMSTALLYGLYVGVFCALVVTDGVKTEEFLSVPVQQMMRVYKEKEEELSEEEKQDYHNLFGDWAFEYYHPKISDMVKNNMNMEEFEANKEKYLSLYCELGKRYPEVYMNSFLQNTYGFWYPKAQLILGSDGEEGYFQCISRGPVGNKSPSMIPFIWDYYQLFSNSSLVCGDSFSVIFFAPATFFWIFLFVSAYLLWKKQRNELIVMAFVLLLWMTYLLGPVVLVRYVAFLFYMFPLELTFLIKGNIKK